MVGEAGDALTEPEHAATADDPATAQPSGVAEAAAVDIAPDDPLLAILQSATAPVEVARLALRSDALDQLREDGIEVIVPLVTQGELIGALYLGPRLSEQAYSVDDRQLLSSLAGRAAPAIRVAQLVRTQAAETAERERMEQEMRVATMIQQQFLVDQHARKGRFHCLWRRTGFGQQVEVLKPEGLREEFASTARRLAEIYR